MLSAGRIPTLVRSARLLRMARSPARFLRLIRGNATAPEPLAIPSLSPGRIYIRPHASDRSVLYATLWGGFGEALGYVSRGHPTRVWDLGANIGLTAAFYAMQLPLAKITGIELDEDNADMARRNTAVFGDRCQIITGAVWVEDGSVSYAIKPGAEQQARVTEGRSGRRVVSYSLNTLFAGDPSIDLVKMDIEGAEAHVLRENTAWAAKIEHIYVECHSPYTAEEATRDLEGLGFTVGRSAHHRAAVTGRRKGRATDG